MVELGDGWRLHTPPASTVLRSAGPVSLLALEAGGRALAARSRSAAVHVRAPPPVPSAGTRGRASHIQRGKSLVHHGQCCGGWRVKI